MMKRLMVLAVFALALVGLIGWERSLVESEAEARRAGARIKPLLTEEMLEGKPIAAYRLDTGRGETFVYGYFDDVWRSLDAYGAAAQQSVIRQILPAIMDARGIVRTRDPGRASDFGFDGESMLRFSLAGPEIMQNPEADSIFAFDIGRSIPETGGSFVRPLGTDEIWAVSMDLRPLFEPGEQPGVPPMLDPHIIPEAWPGTLVGIGAIRIDRAGEEPLILAREEVERSPQEIERGLPSWQWIVEGEDGRYVAEPNLVYDYGMFLLRMPYTGILAPAPEGRPELGLDNPRAMVTLQPAEGDPLTLVIGASGPRGGVVVFNGFTQTIFEVAPAVVERLLPRAEHVLDPEYAEFWRPFLRDGGRRGPAGQMPEMTPPGQSFDPRLR